MKTCVIAHRSFAISYHKTLEEVRWHLRLEKPVIKIGKMYDIKMMKTIQWQIKEIK